MNYKKIKLLFISVIVISTMLLLLPVINISYKIYASCTEFNTVNSTEKIKSRNYSLDEDFSNNSFVVMLNFQDSKYRGISDEIKNNLEKMDNVASVVSLTDLPENCLDENGMLFKVKDGDLYDYYQEHSFKQILKINLNSSDKQIVLDTIKIFSQFDFIDYAEPNFICHGASVISSPNDILYDNQWALNDIEGIDVESAWTITKGSYDVRVGVIDTGIANHPDFSIDQYNSNVVFGIDLYYLNINSYYNMPIDWALAFDASDDDGGHGTSVAGIIGAIGNNGIGVSGINQMVSLVALQAAMNTTGSGYFYWSEVISAITFATGLWNSEQRISVLNLSVSGNNYSSILSMGVNYPGLLVHSAGNDCANICPNYCSNIIEVGAIDRNNERSIWVSNSSNYGTGVDIYAPGGATIDQSDYINNICTTYINSDYRSFNGTSAAAPHVTGVAALMLSVNPNLTGAQLKSLILDNADTILITIPEGNGNGNGTTTTPVKKLNAFKSVAAALLDIDSYGQITGFLDTDINYSGTVVIPDTLNGITVTGISDGAFNDNYNGDTITNVILPNTITSIGAYAFGNCTNLTNINIPSGVTSIGMGAFYNCSSLSSVNIPASVTSVSENCFNGCTSLTGIDIPANVTNIGNNAFYGCSDLETVLLRNSNTVVGLGTGTFGGTAANLKIYVPNGLTSLYMAATDWSVYSGSIEPYYMVNGQPHRIGLCTAEYSGEETSWWEPRIYYFLNYYNTYVYEQQYLTDDFYIYRDLNAYGYDYVDHAAFFEINYSAIAEYSPQTVIDVRLCIDVGSTYDGEEVLFAYYTDYEEIDYYEVTNGIIEIDLTDVFGGTEDEFIIFPADDDTYIGFALQDVTLTISYLDYVPIFD